MLKHLHGRAKTKGKVESIVVSDIEKEKRIKCWCARVVEGSGFVIRLRKHIVSSNLTISSILREDNEESSV